MRPVILHFFFNRSPATDNHSKESSGTSKKYVQIYKYTKTTDPRLRHRLVALISCTFNIVK